jgi:hypothetical protein
VFSALVILSRPVVLVHQLIPTQCFLGTEYDLFLCLDLCPVLTEIVSMYLVQAASNSLARIPYRALYAALGVLDDGSVVEALQKAQPPNGGESKLVLVDPAFCTPGDDLSPIA